MITKKHCDEFIDDESAPPPLRAFLTRARSPAHGHLTSEPFPRLFADHKDARVRVVMASRLGDVGITTDLGAEHGYQLRVDVEDLSNFGDPLAGRGRCPVGGFGSAATIGRH